MEPAANPALSGNPPSGLRDVSADGPTRSAAAFALAPVLSRERRDAYLALLLAFLTSRMLLSLAGALALRAAEGDAGPVAGLDFGFLARLFLRWDANWYLTLAEQGYSLAEHPDHPGQSRFGFMPGFPLLVRGLAWMTGWPPFGASLALNAVLFLASLCLVFEYARVLGVGPRAATAAGALICFAPQSFVFSAPYSESLFLFLSAAAMLSLRRGANGTSGLFAAALSAVRVNGVFFAVFAFGVLLRRDGADALRIWSNPARYAPIVLAPLGVFAFWWFCFAVTGDAFAQSSTLRAGWGWSADWPWNNLWHLLRYGFGFERFWVCWSLLAFGASLLLLRLGWYEEFALCACSFALSWSGSVLDSVVRHSIVLFPIFIALAQALDRRPLALAALCAALGIVNAALMAAWALGRQISL